MSFFDDYQRTAESIKDKALEENSRIMRKLSESQQSFELLRFVHFNKDINHETLNHIIVGCMECIYSMIFYGDRIVTNLDATHAIYNFVMKNKKSLFKQSTLFMSADLIPD